MQFFFLFWDDVLCFFIIRTVFVWRVRKRELGKNIVFFSRLLVVIRLPGVSIMNEISTSQFPHNLCKWQENTGGQFRDINRE